MTTTPSFRTRPASAGRPRPIRRRVHVLETVLFAAMAALLLIAGPAVPTSLWVPLLLGLLVAFCVVGFSAQLRAWGTLFVPSLAPSRLVMAVFAASTPLLVGSVLMEAGLAWRVAATVLLPVVFYALTRWDEGPTLKRLAARQQEQARAEDRTAPRTAHA